MKKKILGLALAFVMMLTIVPTQVFANSNREQTPYGELKGTLVGTGGWLFVHYGFNGSTTCSKEAPKLKITIQVVDTATGNEEDEKSTFKLNTKAVYLTAWANDKESQKTGYGCHELIGQQGYVVYTTETKG